MYLHSIYTATDGLVQENETDERFFDAVYGEPEIISRRSVVATPFERPLDFDFLKDRYDYELNRKDALTSALTLPVGILTGLGGVIAVMFRTFSFTVAGLTTPFVGVLVLAVLAFIACLVFLALAWHSSQYEYLPLLGSLDQSLEEYEAYYEGNEQVGAQEFAAKLRRSTIEASDTNTRLNDLRSKSLYRARIALFGVLVFSAFGGVPYVIDQVRA